MIYSYFGLECLPMMFLYFKFHNIVIQDFPEALE